MQRGTRLKFSHLERKSLINRGYIIWPKRELFLAGPTRKILGGQDGSILPAMQLIRAQESLHLASSRILLYNEISFLSPILGPIPPKTGQVFGETRISSTDLCLRFSKLSSRTCLCLACYVHAKIQSRDLFHEPSRDDTRSQIQQRLPYVHCAPCPLCCNSCIRGI